MKHELVVKELDGLVKRMEVDLQKLDRELENILEKYPRYRDPKSSKLSEELNKYFNGE